MMTCGCDDDVIHGILVGTPLRVDEGLWEPGCIDCDGWEDIEEGDFSFRQSDAFEPLRAGHGDADVPPCLLPGEFHKADGAEVEGSVAADDLADGLAQLFRSEEGIDPCAGV